MNTTNTWAKPAHDVKAWLCRLCVVYLVAFATACDDRSSSGVFVRKASAALGTCTAGGSLPVYDALSTAGSSDADRIQNAIDAAAQSVCGGGIVYVSPMSPSGGTWTIDVPLVLRSGVTLRGASVAAAVDTVGGTVGTILKGASSLDFIVKADGPVEHATITDLTLDATSMHCADCGGMDLSQMNDAMVERVEVLLPAGNALPSMNGFLIVGDAGTTGSYFNTFIHTNVVVGSGGSDDTDNDHIAYRFTNGANSMRLLNARAGAAGTFFSVESGTNNLLISGGGGDNFQTCIRIAGPSNSNQFLGVRCDQQSDTAGEQPAIHIDDAGARDNVILNPSLFGVVNTATTPAVRDDNPGAANHVSYFAVAKGGGQNEGRSYFGGKVGINTINKDFYGLSVSGDVKTDSYMYLTKPADGRIYMATDAGVTPVLSFDGTDSHLRAYFGACLSTISGTPTVCIGHDNPGDGRLEVRQGVSQVSTGAKHSHQTSTGPIAAGSSSTVVVPWNGSAFVDTDYTATCNVVDSAGVLQVGAIISVLTNQLQVQVRNVGSSGSTGVLHCIAFHS